MSPIEPEQRQLHAVGGVDHAVDQVKRKDAFMQRHPDVKITTPRENGTGEFVATWLKDPRDPGGVMERASHYMLRFLLDYLDARFGELASPAG